MTDQFELPPRVIDQLFQAAGVDTFHPDGDQLDKLHAFARNVIAETIARLPGEKAGMARMFHDACSALGAVTEAVGVPLDQSGGAEPILEAIRALKAATPSSTARFLFVSMDDEKTGHPTYCADEMAVREAVREAMYFPGATLDADGEAEIIGIASSLVEEGFFNFEGDQPLHLYHLQALTESTEPIRTVAPFSNCQFRECDLPGQCISEGKCHHPTHSTPAVTDEQFEEALEKAGVKWQWIGMPTSYLATVGSTPAKNIFAGFRSLLTSKGGSL